MAGMSGPIGAVAFESELNAIVKEYFEFGSYSRSLSTFEQECKERSKPIGPTEKPQTDKRLLAIQHDLLKLFHYGDRDGFLHLWNENVSPETLKVDDVGPKLEFYLHIYFATHPIRMGQKEEAQAAMQHFKRYIETSGSALSQTTEFLPFYALPFVPNPKDHPSYKELFTDMWVSDLQVRLERYLTLALKPTRQSRLFDLYRGSGSKTKEVVEEIQALRDKAQEAERKSMAYLRRYNKQQADYHSLISITADLVDSLEATVRGKMVRPEYLQQVCERLFSNQARQTVDFSRPGTAGDMLRQSVAHTSRDSPSPSAAPRKSAPRSDTAPFPSLDYPRVKRDLIEGEERLKALLLQALRWRLTRSTPGVQREGIMKSYIKHDLLGCGDPREYRDQVLGLLLNPSEVVRQYMARLMNAFASLCTGRTYLSKNDALLHALVGMLQAEEKDTATRDNVLGALQKLSLRRHMQSGMIDEGLILWLVQTLEDHDSLSDYTLEYSVALLMNLCLRTSGKRKCSENPRLVLKVLSDLLGHENQEIRPYVNGALYSILGVASIREEAKAMDMESILKCFIKDEQPDMNRQIEFIITQLNASEDAGADGAVSDDEDDDEEDGEDQEAMEADIDKAEILKASAGELSGERLLTQEYLGLLSDDSPRLDTGVRRKARHESYHDEMLTRPTTPGHLHGKTGSRPPTRSRHVGSRPNTQQRSVERPKTRAGSRPSSRDGRQPAEAVDENYAHAFSSRPRVLRTPDPSSRPPRTPAQRGTARTPDNGVRPTSRGSITGYPPPQPKYSDGSPQSRPNSGDGQRRSSLKSNR